MLRVFWRSFLEPLRSFGTSMLLLGVSLTLWFGAAISMLVAERSAAIPWTLDALGRWVFGLMLIPILALTLPLISGEARDRTLLLQLLQPIPRTHYYTGRVLGRASLAAVYFAATLGGTYVVIRTISDAIFAGSGTSPVPPNLAATILFSGLTLVSVVFSFCALAPVSSSRFGHVVYWAGFFVVVKLGRQLVAAPDASPLEQGIGIAVVELLQPFLLGASEALAREAALGPWYLTRALLQWAFGIALAYLVGIVAFSRMEVAQRT